MVDGVSAKPAPVTFSCNAGPPAITVEGVIEVIITPAGRGSPGFEGDPEVAEAGVDPPPQPARTIQQSTGSNPQAPWTFMIPPSIASSQAVPECFVFLSEGRSKWRKNERCLDFEQWWGECLQLK
jgi:hypothetical protein